MPPRQSAPAPPDDVESQAARAFTAAGDLAASDPEHSAAARIARVVEGTRELDAVARHLLLLETKIIGAYCGIRIETQEASAGVEHEALQPVVLGALLRSLFDER